MPTSHQPIAIFSGGSAANSLAPIFNTLAASKSCPLAYIIPISDNGGSSSELIRVFGGPGIGDVRSRLVRLIPRLAKSSPGWREREGIRSLLSHRLSSVDARLARHEWNDVVDGTSALWKEISSAKKELLRAIFNLVNLEIIKRSRPPGSTFDFTSASVGNLFLTGARLFTGSFESSIYLMSSICGINDEDVKVVPSINSNFSHHIAAGLADGSVIVGQNAISHPSPAAEGRDGRVVANMTGFGVVVSGDHTGEMSEANAEYDERRLSLDHYYGDEEAKSPEQELIEEEEDANLPGSLPTLRTKNIAFNKNENEELPAKISRIWYINPYGQEILPPANPRAIAALSNAQAIIYSIGSLYTSLVPSLILKGMGSSIRKASATGGSRLRTKILILNGSLDREVGPPPRGMEKPFSALDFVEAIVRAGEQSRGVIWEGSRKTSKQIQTINEPFPQPHMTASSFKRPVLPTFKSESQVSTLAYRQGSQLSHLFPPPLPASSAPSRNPSPPPSPIPSEVASLSSSTNLSGTQTPPPSIVKLTKRTTEAESTIDSIYTSYITHIIHLPNSPTTPFVDQKLLHSKCGIQTVKVYGRTEPNGDGGMRYDHAALRGAIEAIVGRNPDKTRSPRSSGKLLQGDSHGKELDDDDGREDDESEDDKDGDGATHVTEDEKKVYSSSSAQHKRSKDHRSRLRGMVTGRRNTLDSY